MFRYFVLYITLGLFLPNNILGMDASSFDNPKEAEKYLDELDALVAVRQNQQRQEAEVESDENGSYKEIVNYVPPIFSDHKKFEMGGSRPTSLSVIGCASPVKQIYTRANPTSIFERGVEGMSESKEHDSESKRLVKKMPELVRDEEHEAAMKRQAILSLGRSIASKFSRLLVGNTHESSKSQSLPVKSVIQNAQPKTYRPSYFPCLQFLSAAALVRSDVDIDPRSLPSQLLPYVALMKLPKNFKLQLKDLKFQDFDKKFICKGKISRKVLNKTYLALEKYNYNPLSLVIEFQDIESLNLLLSEPALNVNPIDQWGFTPLSYAAADGFLPGVQALLKRPDVGVNIQDGLGMTPIMHAGERGHEAIVAALMEHPSIDLSLVDKANRLAFEHTVRKNQTDVPANPTVIFDFLKNNDENKLIEFLCMNQVAVNFCNTEGCSPLICAASEGYLQGVEVLLACSSIDVNIQDAEGFTALMRACQKGHTLIASILMRNVKVDSSLKDRDGNTAYDHAEKNNHNAITHEFTQKTLAEF